MCLSYYQDVMVSDVMYNTPLGEKTSTQYGDVPSDVRSNILNPDQMSPVLGIIEAASGMFSFMLSFIILMFKAVFYVPFILKEVGLPIEFVAIITTAVWVVYGVAIYQIYTSRNVSMSE